MFCSAYFFASHSEIHKIKYIFDMTIHFVESDQIGLLVIFVDPMNIYLHIFLKIELILT
jgi:hypothetical protein